MTNIASGTTITYNRESKTTSRTRTWRSLPPQKVSKATKSSREWQESNLDAIIGMSQARGDNGRSPRFNKQENYDIINGKYKASNFQSVLNEYNYSDTQFIKPETAITNYNIIRQKLETLKGEEMKMGLNFRAGAGWYTLENGDKIQGKDKVIEFFNNDLEEKERIKQKILNLLKPQEIIETTENQ